jgi:pimeloyl-ACP methyl ester carboxylesterase
VSDALPDLVTHRYADLRDVRLHYVEAGEGPLVVLLHGFPQFWYMWRFQIPALVEAGFRVVAPDMRGYNLSGKPPEVSDYQVELLARDVGYLIEGCGVRTATVVGHDWGAAVAWLVAMLYPERVERLAILNVPHPVRFLRGLWTLRQLRKSWYVFALQVPGPPGRLIERGIFARFLLDVRHDPVRPGSFTEEDVERYREAMARPGSLTAACNYYRALFRGNPARTRMLLRKIEAPVIVIWGEKDRYLNSDLAEPDRTWVPNLCVERLPDASHWVGEDRPDKVNALLLEFLDASP